MTEAERTPARWLVTRAVRASGLPAPAKLVMLVLADVADLGTAEIPPYRTPSLTVLAKETGLSRSTVAKHLLDLEEVGWVVRIRPETAEALGTFERTRYLLRVPESEPSAADGLVQETDQEAPEPSAGDGLPSAPPGPPSAADGPPSAADGPPSAGAGHRNSSSPVKNQIEQIENKPSTSVAVPTRLDVEQVCRHLADRIEENGSKRPNISKAWRDAARRLIDRDGKSVDQIIKAIDWCQDDEFWRSNILSMPKLREQYDRLRLAAQRANGRGNGHRPSTTDQRVADALALANQLEQVGNR